MNRTLLPFVLLLAACHSGDDTRCNGHQELCARRYDEVAYAGTHDADSDLADNFLAADQSFTLTRQLADGIRVLHLEIYPWMGAPYLCHAYCAIGATLLTQGLTEIARFVEAHPRDVVTLLLESNDTSSDDVWQAVTAAGLARYATTQTLGTPWPTLGALIASQKRVVLLVADQTNTGGGQYAALLPRWQWTWETPWDNRTLGDFARCNADRGTAGAPLYVVDTYLEERAFPSISDAQMVNSNPFLIDRLLHCSMATGRSPNFVMVNYYQEGDLFADVDALNGFGAIVSGNLDQFAGSDVGDAGLE